MQIDKQTFNDIAIFQNEEEFSIFHKLNFTRTNYGREWLKYFFNEPHSDLRRILGTQKIIQTLSEKLDQWPANISNGTLLVMEKYLDYSLDPMPEHPNPINSFFYRALHSEDYSMIKYSVKHFADFFQGIRQLGLLFEHVDLPAFFKIYIDRLLQLLREPALEKLAAQHADSKLTPLENIYFGYQLRNRYKTNTLELIDIFGRLDAWYSMAHAVKTYQLSFPTFIESDAATVRAKGLYHILLPRPTAYDVDLDPSQNFLFLTGANMAGKSTLIKSMGAAVFLAHMGMGVPAKEFTLTLMDGLLTNINVMDNIAKGESYFFNEVQRIRHTIEKINNGRKWLVLIDELFKGTNVQDAMKCSLTVIKGLIKIKNSLFILSTHLYEIGEELKSYPNISFRYFETNVTDEQLEFSYQLREGISNDRLGYLILKREKVVEMLERL
ncbi:MAG: DNA mismatch repair protein MutS [Chitinophagaceae bacterium]|nr:DNA mismatch repair protein MutS [Chitinophagaceae bacterium]